MKTFILEFSLIVIVAIGFGCQKEQWETIELNSNICDGLTKVDYSFTGYSGFIDTISGNNSTFVIKGVEPGFIEDVVFWPCNLPDKYNQVGLEISFSGDVLKKKGWTPGSPGAVLTGTPIVITEAKIKFTD